MVCFYGNFFFGIVEFDKIYCGSEFFVGKYLNQIHKKKRILNKLVWNQLASTCSNQS